MGGGVACARYSCVCETWNFRFYYDGRYRTHAKKFRWNKKIIQRPERGEKIKKKNYKFKKFVCLFHTIYVAYETRLRRSFYYYCCYFTSVRSFRRYSLVQNDRHGSVENYGGPSVRVYTVNGLRKRNSTHAHTYASFTRSNKYSILRVRARAPPYACVRAWPGYGGLVERSSGTRRLVNGNPTDTTVRSLVIETAQQRDCDSCATTVRHRRRLKYATGERCQRRCKENTKMSKKIK